MAPERVKAKGVDTNLQLFAVLAQLVEQGFCKSKVTGSNPVDGTIS
ncbi:hypothetical protein STASHLEY_01010 [Brevundimonas phage vB_BpoS-StAshley]|nr:hypothetical protein STASHLEY_01010 [Brevundimonas phage vB_BpoS-StAshley]